MMGGLATCLSMVVHGTVTGRLSSSYSTAYYQEPLFRAGDWVRAGGAVGRVDVGSPERGTAPWGPMRGETPATDRWVRWYSVLVDGILQAYPENELVKLDPLEVLAELRK